jgi:putative transposase
MRKTFITPGHPQLSLRRQSTLLRVNRNRLTVNARKPRANDLALCHEIDKLHLERPFFGSRRIADELQARGLAIGRTRTRRLMRTMGLVATYPKPRTSIKSAENKVYPHLLRQLEIKHPNQVRDGPVSGASPLSSTSEEMI